MAGDYASVGISQNRVYKAESDRPDDLIYMLFSDASAHCAGQVEVCLTLAARVQ
jgi:hypothetical protein